MASPSGDGDHIQETEMDTSYYIKDATVRKVKNRGFTPVWYHSPYGQTAGWIYKTGREGVYFYSATLGKVRLPKNTRFDVIK